MGFVFISDLLPYGSLDAYWGINDKYQWARGKYIKRCIHCRGEGKIKCGELADKVRILLDRSDKEYSRICALPTTRLAKYLTTRTARAITHRVSTIGELLSMTRHELCNTSKGIGKKSAEEIERVLERMGLCLTED